MATVTLPVGTGTQQWTPPGDCFVIDKIELWGPGGSGGKRTGARVTGGGAGAYNVVNGPIPVSPLLVSGTIPYNTGRGGAAQATAGTAGNPGTSKTWFSAIGVLCADLGLGGLASGTSGATAGGAGGLVANSIPTTAALAGGNGGTDSSTSGASSGGASGSGAGAGVSGAAISTGVAGGTTTAPAGGGNGGAASITTSNATNGSSPGGGGGAHNGATGNSGAGADGAITITYTPSLVATQVWSPLQSSPTVVISNSGLTASSSAPTVDVPSYGAIGLTTGLIYWEIDETFTTAGHAEVGIGNTLSAIAAGSYVGSDTTSIGWGSGGAVITAGGGINLGPWATWTTGQRLCLALDLPNHKLWGRVGSGNWNNDVIGNQNPATNTGGAAIPSGVYNNPIVPALNTWDATAVGHGYFDYASWNFTPPVGFGPFVPFVSPSQVPNQSQTQPILAQ